MVDRGAPLWLDGLLRCPQCGAASLQRAAPGYSCAACASTYPVSNAVPLLIKPSALVDFAARIGQAVVGAGEAALDPAAVEAALGTALRYRLKDPTLRDEFSNIIGRYSAVLGDPGGALPASGSDRRLAVLTDYFNPRFSKGAVAHRSIRVRNDLAVPLASTGERPYHLSYFLTGKDGARIEGPRSKFPIPLLPGGSLTVPVRIEVPLEVGRYTIAVMLVQEFVGWHADTPLFVSPVDVVDDAGYAPGLSFTAHQGYFDYPLDLRYCGDVLKAAVRMARTTASGDTVRVLEIACGQDPLVFNYYQPETEVVACDLCWPQTQIGSLIYQARWANAPDRFAFLAADVFNAPFVDGAFDVVVVVAALHHFADVVEALRTLRRLVRPGGKVVLLREPGQVAADDPVLIEELMRGFNEQQFEPAEYDVMFDRAGLKVLQHQMDFGCSYKVILEAA